MERFQLYEDIKQRTGGDIYLGVVGPVRCGKSTFITKFMQSLVIPNIDNPNNKKRVIDELPQSADGKTVMTTQPKFVPNEAVHINLNNVDLNVRLIDCVGYMINGALGHEEGEKPRLVKTPWSAEEMPFEQAAEIGTQKVIEDHSSIGVLMTTDGTITDIPRSSYVEAEERVAKELKQSKKPYVIVVNSKDPNSQEAQTLANALSQKYGASALAINVLEMTNDDVENIIEKVLEEFPVKSVKVTMPDWLNALDYDNPLIQEIINNVKEFTQDANKIGEISKTISIFDNNDNFEPITVGSIKMGEGYVYFNVKPKQHLFYKVLSDECGCEIANDYQLVAYIKELAYAKMEYDKIAGALEQVKQTGYGVVAPKLEDMTLDDPQIVKQGSRFGVKLKASAPSLHIMSVDVETELNPLVGTQTQSEELVKYLNEEFEKDPASIWETNMFGKSLHTLVSEGINSKIVMMPQEAQRKMRKTLGRIVNEGKGGIICILL